MADLRKMLGGISKKLAYRLLVDGDIQSVRVGRAYKIPKVCIIEYLLGHSAFSTTADIYARLNFSAQEASAAAMGGMFVRESHSA